MGEEGANLVLVLVNEEIGEVQLVIILVGDLMIREKPVDVRCIAHVPSRVKISGLTRSHRRVLSLKVMSYD